MVVHAKISGWLLVITGVLHVGTGIVSEGSVLAGMIRDGLWLSAIGSPERQFAAWFTFAGLGFMLMGLLCLDRERPLSATFGWALALVAVLGAVLFGGSGFTLLLPQAVYIFVIAYRRRPAARID